MASLLPLFIRCERYDVGTEHISPYEERNRSLRLILYDVHSGGVGIALKVRLFLSVLVLPLTVNLQLGIRSC